MKNSPLGLWPRRLIVQEVEGNMAVKSLRLAGCTFCGQFVVTPVTQGSPVNRTWFSTELSTGTGDIPRPRVGAVSRGPDDKVALR